MNTKLSGAQLVLVEIKRVGRNYFPLVENLRGRMIKYIDFCPCDYLPDTTARGSDGTDMYVTIMNEHGTTELHRDMPLERFNYAATLGVRQPVCAKVNMQASYVTCMNESEIGRMAAFMFYYDLPEYSARNTSDAAITDAVNILLTSPTGHNALPDVDRLTGKRFRRIMLGSPTITPEGTPCVEFSRIQNLFITLRKGTYNVVENMPLQLLWQPYLLEKTEFANILFDFQSSYITIGGMGTIPYINEYIGRSVFLNLQYEAK